MPEASSPPRRDFPLLFGGQIVSRLGDRLALIAFPWLVYSTTGSTLSTGVVLAMFTLPYVLFGALAGAVIDRSRKRSLMIAVDVIRAALVAAVPFVAPHSLTAVYVLTFLTACATVFFDPCLLALVPDVVPKDRLLRANSILATGDNLTEIVGFAAAGVLVAVLTTKTAFLIDAATFLVSALAIALMVTGRASRDSRRDERRRARGTERRRSAKAAASALSADGAGEAAAAGAFATSEAVPAGHGDEQRSGAERRESERRAAERRDGERRWSGRSADGSERRCDVRRGGERRRGERRRVRAIASAWVQEIVRDEAWWHGMAPTGAVLASAAASDALDGRDDLGAAERREVPQESPRRDETAARREVEADALRRTPATPKNLLREMREGFDYLAHHRGLRANTLLTVAGVAGIGAAYPLTFLLAVEVFDGTRSFGFMEAAIGAGYLIGSMGLVALAQRVRKGLAMTIGMAVMGGGLCVIASLSNLVPVLVAFAVVGVANAIVLIAIDTYLQEAIPAELRGRVLGLRFTITQGVYAVGVLAAGALAATVALDWLFLAVGLIVAVPALVGLLTPSVSDV